MSIPVVVGADGHGNPTYDFIAIGPKGQTAWLNVWSFAQASDYNATGGTLDAALMINRAIAYGAANFANGFTVYLPASLYTLYSSVVVSVDGVKLCGDGRGTQLVAQASFPAATPMIWYQAPGGGAVRQGARICDLLLVNTAGPTSVIGIELDCTYYAVIERCDIEGVYAQNIALAGPGGVLGAYTHVSHCHLGAVPGGATSGGFGILTNNHEFNTVEACVFNWFAVNTGRAIKLQNDNNTIVGCTFDECDTSIDLAFQPRNTIIGNQFDRGLTRYIYLEGASQSVITGNIFGGQGGGATGTRVIEANGGGNASNRIAHNVMQSGTSGWTTFYFEAGGIGGAAAPNVISDNETQGLAITLVTGVARNNRGVNPVGKTATQPAIAASTTPVTNTTGYDCTVYLTGGTFTGNHQIGGQSIGNSTVTALRVAAGQTVTLTYSAAPTWIWIGD